MIAYEQGPDIIQVFGPPYVSPTALSIRMEASAPLATREGARCRGAAGRPLIVDCHPLMGKPSPYKAG